MLNKCFLQSNFLQGSPPHHSLEGLFYILIGLLESQCKDRSLSSPKGASGGLIFLQVRVLRWPVVKAMILHCKSYDIRR